MNTDLSYDLSGADVAAAGAIGGVAFVIYLAVLVFMIVAMWKVFAKAGKPGWAAIVPIYNIIVMLEIAGMPAWYVLLFFVPIANIVIAIMMNVKLAKVFGKSIGYAIGLILLPIVFWPMLGFGKSQYIGTSATTAAPTAHTIPSAPQQM